jgi:hypothetical protein
MTNSPRGALGMTPRRLHGPTLPGVSTHGSSLRPSTGNDSTAVHTRPVIHKPADCQGKSSADSLSTPGRVNLMEYQLMVWEGTRPETDLEGGRVSRELLAQYFVGGGVEPTRAIREFVAALTERWTDDPGDPEFDAGPWAGPSILDGASGPALLLNLTFDIGPLTSCLIAHLAEERGLVAFDPQLEWLRPVSEDFAQEYLRRREVSNLN